MPTVITSPLLKKCKECNTELPQDAKLKEQGIPTILGTIALIMLLGGPIAVYFMIQIADEAHRGISLKMILVALVVGVLPSFGLFAIAGKFKKIALQVCGKCNHTNSTMVTTKIVDKK
jgi:drug/metabolite transporter (DMT)-like permease